MLHSISRFDDCNSRIYIVINIIFDTILELVSNLEIGIGMIARHKDCRGRIYVAQ